MLIVRSPVRISFAGGGTDLPAYYERFGGAVLSTTIDKYFYATLRKRDHGGIQIISSDLHICQTWRDIAAMEVGASQLEIPLAVFKDLACEMSVDLFLASEIPPGTGLGSSATVCVNMLKLLTTYLGCPISRYELAERAFHIARNVLGHHVGRQDEFAAAFGGLNFFTFQTDGFTQVQPLDLEPELLQELESNLMLFFTGSAHHSWTILEQQEKSTEMQDGRTVEALHDVKALAGRMKEALYRGELQLFGSLLDEEWQAKKHFCTNVSNPRIDHFYDLARRSGARGGKITGAGGGGFLLLYCEPKWQNAVTSALQTEGVERILFGFDKNGAQVLVQDEFIDGDQRTGSRWIFTPLSTVAA